MTIEPVDVHGPPVWCLIYNTAAALAYNRQVDGRIVAVVLLLESRGALTVRELADALVIGASAASKMTDNAARIGLVEKRTDPGDSRRVVVSLTAAARQRLRRAGR